MHLVYSIITSLILSMNISSSIPYGAIKKAFESNNAKEIVDLGKSKILINVLGKEGVYSQSQSKLILQKFFEKSPCKKFDYMFQGKEASDGTFAIGNYTSTSSKYRVTVYFKKVGDSFKIESLRIENG